MVAKSESERQRANSKLLFATPAATQKILIQCHDAYVCEELAAVRREIKQRQRRESRERADMLRWGLTAHMVRMTLAVYCLSNYSQDCAIEFAENARKRRALRVPSLEDAPCPIRDLVPTS